MDTESQLEQSREQGNARGIVLVRVVRVPVVEVKLPIVPVEVERVHPAVAIPEVHPSLSTSLGA